MAADLQSFEISGFLRADGATWFNEDCTIEVTIDGSGTIAAWTLAAEMFDASNTSVTAPDVDITDAEAREVTLTFSGLSLTTQTYRCLLFRTDSGARTLTAKINVSVFNERR